MKVATNRVLTRDEFRRTAMERDGGLCVNCKDIATEVHHIIERRCFDDGGYYLDNAASVCNPCHILAEQTILSCEELRVRADIKDVCLPNFFYPDYTYTKWGDIILPNGMRTKGELFHDESVQKILKSVLHLYTPYVKHPRTPHLPWSPNMSSDDKLMPEDSLLRKCEVVVSTKYDGEQFSFYKNYMHARSIDSTPESAPHPSRTEMKKIHAHFGFDIPEHYRIVGENVYAKHSIHYTDLESWFYLFSVWNEKNVCLSWDETKEWAELLNLTMVPEIYRGVFDEKAIEKAFEPYKNFHEGYVVRLTDAFPYRAYRFSTAKYVRPGHVQTTRFWFREPVVPNLLSIS